MTKETYNMLKEYLEKKVNVFDEFVKLFKEKELDGSKEICQLAYKKGEIIPYEYAMEFVQSHRKEKSIKGFNKMIRTLKGPDMEEILNNSVFVYHEDGMKVTVFPFDTMSKKRKTALVKGDETTNVSTEVGLIPVDVLEGFGLSSRIVHLLKENNFTVIDIFDNSPKKIKGISNGSLRKIKESVIKYMDSEKEEEPNESISVEETNE